MSDFDSPNGDAMESMGLIDKFLEKYPQFTDLPDNFMKDSYNNMDSWWQAHGQIPDASWNDYPGEEGSEHQEAQAAFADFYESDIAYNWDELVKEYKENIPKPDGEGEFNENQDYINETYQDEFDAPPVENPWTGEGGSSDGVTVDTAALDHFVKQLRLIVPPDGNSGVLIERRNKLNELDLRPGTFGWALLMKDKIVGADGLAPDMSGFLTAAKDAIIRTADLLEAVSKTYAETEDDTTISASAFDKQMEDAWTAISALENYGQSESDGESLGQYAEPEPTTPPA